jgi:hypothetical protein
MSCEDVSRLTPSDVCLECRSLLARRPLLQPDEGMFGLTGERIRPIERELGLWLVWAQPESRTAWIFDRDRARANAEKLYKGNTRRRALGISGQVRV